MKNLNNKGFAVSTILYGLLSLMILILMLIFAIMKSNKDMNEDLVESLTESMNVCASLEAKIENCYFTNGIENCYFTDGKDFNQFSNLYKTCVNEKGIKKLKDLILLNNTIKSDASLSFATSSATDGTKGLYYTDDNTRGNEITYYFRGAVENNYVKFGKWAEDYVVYKGYSNTDDNMDRDFATLSECNSSAYNKNCTRFVYANKGDDMYWRIVRINEDGSIRLIYQGTSATSTGDYASIGHSTFNTLDTSNGHSRIGYMYGSQNYNDTYQLIHANNTSSKIKTFLDNWYVSNLSNYSEYLEDSGFCNDRSLFSGTGTEFNESFYGIVERLTVSKHPQFDCPNANNDLFTLKESTFGNNVLEYPIGLINADEVVYAGGSRGYNNTSFYLNTGSNMVTMSPYYSYPYVSTIMYLNASGNLLEQSVFNPDVSVRPVINLRADVEVENLNNDGTIGNEYKIKIK